MKRVQNITLSRNLIIRKNSKSRIIRKFFQQHCTTIFKKCSYLLNNKIYIVFYSLHKIQNKLNAFNKTLGGG
ncbi:hypothetical protein ME3_01065 [Bartonella melophagi K-2C]|uniref:Uncharacterized protein n=1 Tax=Bartonella melophagi K-2C TaxID=1094557 RepID=J0ZJN5_9HYPH|nr:hypothetical protein ME3_01065 [Bartonella melophagi K-2C]